MRRMCGRYVVAYDPDTLVEGFSLVRIQPFPKRWNVAPTTDVPVVFDTKGGERVCEPMRWGLVPHWAKDASGGAKLNNARVEGIAEKPSFRQALRRRRCLLPASGYYEWQAVPQPGGKVIKQPWYISPTDAPFFAMAGLFEAWRPPGSDASTPWLLTCCVVTTEASPQMAHIHDRMPLMIPREQWSAWLSRANQDPASVTPLLAAALPAGRMQAWPVSREVSRSSSEGEALIAPLA
jgi:putative SOS response-associated peptidase YedK